MKAHVFVTLKKEVLDPQGSAVKRALEHMGFEGLQSVRIGKYIELDVHSDNKSKLQKQVQQMSQRLLSNPVIEDFRVEIEAINDSEN